MIQFLRNSVSGTPSYSSSGRSSLLAGSDAGKPPLQDSQPRPNTHLLYPVFTPHKKSMPQGPLNADAWEDLLNEYPDKKVVTAAVGIIRYGARIGYRHNGSRSSKSLRIHPNHRSAESHPELVEKNLKDQLSHGRLQEYEQPPKDFVGSPVGLVDKSLGEKRRIHDLSFPLGFSINDGIREAWGTIRHPTFEEVLGIVASMGDKCVLLKRDFEDAFRHIPVDPRDSLLLGFSWNGKYYSERFLPFGLRTSPFLFNLFAELFHWLLERYLQPFGAQVMHYIDDFLVILPPDTDMRSVDRVYMDLTTRLGFRVKVAKNEEGFIVDYGGFKIDTMSMEARLSDENREKVKRSTEKYLEEDSISLVDLQSLLGLLAFTYPVIPLGRKFTQRLMILQNDISRGRGRNKQHPISAEAKKDLEWWRDLFTFVPMKRFPSCKRPEIMAWADGFSSSGLGGYYLSPGQKLTNMPNTQAFATAFPKGLVEDLDTKGMRAVEQCLLLYGKLWQHHKVVMHIGSKSVERGISSGLILGDSMDVLQRCLLLAAKLDVDLVPLWVFKKNNQLAQALSSFNQSRIGSLCPNLKSLPRTNV